MTQTLELEPNMSVGMAAVTSAAFLFGTVAALVKYAAVPPLVLLMLRSVMQLILALLSIKLCGPSAGRSGATSGSGRYCTGRSHARGGLHSRACRLGMPPALSVRDPPSTHRVPLGPRSHRLIRLRHLYAVVPL